MSRYAVLVTFLHLVVQLPVHAQSRLNEPAQSSRVKSRPEPTTPTEETRVPNAGQFTTLEFRGLPVAVSEDSQRLAYLLQEKGITVINFDTGAELLSLKEEKVVSAAFSPDGARLAAMRSSGDVVIWDIASGKEVGQYDSDGKLKHFPICMRFIDDQRLAFTAYTEVIVWNLQDDSTQTIEIGKDQTHAIAVSPDGRRLIIGTGWFPLIWPHPSGGGPPRIAPGKAIVWDVESQSRLDTLAGHRDFGIYSIVFTPDGQQFATGAGDVLLWDAETLEKRAVYTCPKGKYAWSMDVSADGQWLAVAIVWDGPVQLVNLQTGEQRTLTVDGGRFGSVHFLAGEENRLLTGGADGRIRLWSIR